MKIYAASSWRNKHQQNVVRLLREDGHDVYDFQHPPGGDSLGFSWADVDPKWADWTPEQYIKALHHPIAEAGYQSDFAAMNASDACVLVLPCGKSAHLEAGWFTGKERPVIVLLDEAEFAGGANHSNIELMYKMTSFITTDLEEVVAFLQGLEGR